MRLLAIIFATATAAFGQAATTTIVGPVAGPDGPVASAKVIFTLSAPCTAPGPYFIGVRDVTVAVSAGTMSAKLVPNDTCNPVGHYDYKMTLNGGATKTGTCVVPTSGSPLMFGSVCTASPAGALLPQSPLSAIVPGAAPGYYCINVSNTGVMTLTTTGCPGSGGGGSLLLSALTNGQLLALTNSQLLTLGN